MKILKNDVLSAVCGGVYLNLVYSDGKPYGKSVQVGEGVDMQALTEFMRKNDLHFAGIDKKRL